MRDGPRCGNVGLGNGLALAAIAIGFLIAGLSIVITSIALLIEDHLPDAFIAPGPL